MMLKTIKNITMAPAALEILQNANAIESLVKIMTAYLDVTVSSPSRSICSVLAHLPSGSLTCLYQEICNPLVNALYNLCRLSKSRQEEAAMSGAIPALQSLINANSPLKQFALPIICDFAHASKTCRKVLWHHNIFPLYVSLLRDSFWNLSALEAILAWMQDETSRVEDALLQDVSVEALLNAFSSAKSTSLENFLEPLLKVRLPKFNLSNCA